MKNKPKVHKKKTAKKILTFREAVAATPAVHLCFKPGKQAIPNAERSKVELADTGKCGGSLFIDQCLIDQGIDPNGNRWDYAIDYDGKVYFIEVHTASSGEVSTVIRKLEWLKRWLHTTAPEINNLKATARTPFYWVQSNGYHIPRGSAYERNAIQNGIKPIARLILK